MMTYESPASCAWMPQANPIGPPPIMRISYAISFSDWSPVTHHSFIPFCVICQELSEPVIRQRMLQQRQDGRKRPRHDISTDLGTVNNVHGMPYGSGQDLCFVAIVVIYQPYILNQAQ